MTTSEDEPLTLGALKRQARVLEEGGKKRVASDMYVELARRLLDEGHSKGVDDILIRAIGLNGKNADAWHLFGVIHRENGSAYESERAFRKAIKLEPDVATHRVECSVLHYVNMEWDKAETQLRASLQTERTTRGFQYLSLTYVELGDMESAVQLAREAYGLSPEDRQVAFSLGLVLFRAGRTAEAWQAMLRAIEEKRHPRGTPKRRVRDALDLGPESADSWMIMAEVFDRLDRVWEATMALRMAATIHPKNARVWYELSEVVESQEQHEAYLSKAFFLNRNDPDILCANAIDLYESGMEKEALDEFEEVLSIDPGHVTARQWADDIEEKFEELEEMGECPRLGDYGGSVDDDYYYDEGPEDDW